jgi:hypothetical protein
LNYGARLVQSAAVRGIRAMIKYLKRFALFKSYNRYVQALDIFGLVSTLLVVIYLVWPDGYRLADKQDGMIANILSELVGIWVGVRLIDFFIRKNERHDRARVRTVRGMRYLERVCSDIVIHKRILDVALLRRELAWNKKMRGQRDSFLSLDEIADLDAFYAELDDFVKLLPHEQQRAGILTLSFEDNVSISIALGLVEEARTKAEENILEETEEDAGL